MNTLLLLALLLGLLASAAAFLFARRAGRAALARRVAGVAAVGTAAYFSALLLASLASRPHVLAGGEREAFCGFYLDCHLGVSVERVERRAALGRGPRRVEATGVFHVVTLRVSNDARQATLHPGGAVAEVSDAEGRTFGRDRAAEAVLTSTAPDLTRPVAAGAAYTATLVFDLPADATQPRLRVRDPAGVDRVLEALLIGDADSFLHAPTTHALEPVRTS